MRKINNWICILLIGLLTGCVTRVGLAPVEERKWHPLNIHATSHRVQKGDTLYSVAFRYDIDYRKLALLNHLKRPYALRIGQVIWLLNKSDVRAGKARKSPYISPNRRTYKKRKIQPINRFPAKTTQISWYWPYKGKIVYAFSPAIGKKGIDIAGNKGAAVHAASNGVVAYAGSGLLGYGNLIIIKHENQLLTAYGYNARNLVKEGQVVSAGQAIAIMGIIDRRFYGVHFEIRKAGIPVNPMLYIK